jgi:hypothetical protein
MNSEGSIFITETWTVKEIINEQSSADSSIEVPPVADRSLLWFLRLHRHLAHTGS